MEGRRASTPSRHGLSFIRDGSPPKKQSKKTTNPDSNPLTRHAACPETELASGMPASRLHGSRYLGLLAAAPWAPVRYTPRFTSERFIASLGSPERNKAEPVVIALGVWLCFLSPMFPQFLNLSALDRPVKGAWRGYDVAPTHDL
jgi:hypothetical protein